MVNAVVDAALASLRLGAAPVEYTQRFTVDQAEALQRQRHRPGSTRWSWTLQVLRALFALVDGAQFLATPPREAGKSGVRLRFAFDVTALEGVAPSRLLDAALEPDAGSGDGRLVDRQRRFLRLLGRGINESLAFGPCRVEVRLGRRRHRFTVGDRDESPTESVEDLPPSLAETDGCVMEIEVVIDRFVGRWFEAVLGNEGFQETLKLWALHVPGLDLGPSPGILRPVPPAPSLRMGTLGSWWPTDDINGLRLLRDGVLLPTALARDLAATGVPLRDYSGPIEVPQLRLTFDEASVVHDANMSLLVAWLGDVHAHASRRPLPLSARLDGFLADPSRPPQEGRIAGAIWPPTIERVQTVTGHWVELAALRNAARRGIEVAWCWTHERMATPEHLRAGTLMLWPRELAAVQAIPGLRVVPVAALQIGAVSGWGALVQVSYPELDLGAIARSHDIPVRIDVGALVHRRAEAEQGRIEIAAGGSVVAEIRDPDRVLPGVLVVGRVAAGDLAVGSFGPSAQQAALRAIELHARARVDAIVAHARQHATAEDDAPLLRALDREGEARLATPATEATRRSADAAPPRLIVDVVHPEHGGALHVLDRGARGVIEVWLAGQACGTIVLDGPWSRIGGDLGVRSPSTAIDPATVAQLVAQVVAPRIEQMWSLAAPGSELHASLAELANEPRVDVAPAAETGPLLPAPWGTALRQVIAGIVGQSGLRIEPVLTWVPAAWSGGSVIHLGMLQPWVAEGMRTAASREQVSIAAMISLMTLVPDPLAFELAVQRYLAISAAPH